MNKIKIIIINRANSVLYVEYQRCGQSEVQKISVKRRRILKLISGHHILSMGYDGVNLVLMSKMSGIKDHETVSSIGNHKYKGIRLLVNNPTNTLKLKCDETLSVAALIENLCLTSETVNAE